VIENAAFMQRQGRIGSHLEASLLHDAVGQKDFAIYQSEAFFGASNYRIHTKVPIVLAFGHEVGGCMAWLAGSEPLDRRRVSRACALFNLGVSTLDLVHDEHPRLASELAKYFDASALREIASERSARQDWAASNLGKASPEVDFLLGIVLRFFEELEPLIDDVQVRHRLGALLTVAYRSELMSLNPKGNRRHLLETARRKSVRPFELMAAVASLRGKRGPDRLRVRDLGSAVGEVFAEVDDLMDVVVDSRTGAINGLLVAADDTVGEPYGGRPFGVLESILVKKRLEASAARVLLRLRRTLDLLEAAPSRRAIAFRALVLNYLQDWMA
jgi:hypothetical protein